MLEKLFSQSAVLKFRLNLNTTIAFFSKKYFEENDCMSSHLSQRNNRGPAVTDRGQDDGNHGDKEICGGWDRVICVTSFPCIASRIRLSIVFIFYYLIGPYNIGLSRRCFCDWRLKGPALEGLA